MTDSINRRRFLLTLGLGGAALAAGKPLYDMFYGVPGSVNKSMAVTRTGNALGTKVSMTVLHPNSDMANKALSAAFKELETLERIMSIYQPESELSRLNSRGELAGAHPYLVEVLQESARVSASSNGAFDVTVQPLWQAWSAADGQPKDLDTVCRLVDWKKVTITNKHITLGIPGMGITLNGIAQGYAGDRVLAVLKAHGIKHALVDTGEIGTLGQSEDGTPWSLGIQHPEHKDAWVARVRADGRVLATSGGYNTTFGSNARHHHLLDPRTGLPANQFSSVSILAPTGMLADALSTAVFIAGPEEGARLISTTPGVDGLLVTTDGRVRTSKGFPQEHSTS